MPRLTKLLLALSLLSFVSFANANEHGAPPASKPPAAIPVGPGFGLGVASAVSGHGVPRGPVGTVPEPETWVFTMAGVLLGLLLRRRR